MSVPRPSVISIGEWTSVGGPRLVVADEGASAATLVLRNSGWFARHAADGSGAAARHRIQPELRRGAAACRGTAPPPLCLRRRHHYASSDASAYASSDASAICS